VLVRSHICVTERGHARRIVVDVRNNSSYVNGAPSALRSSNAWRVEMSLELEARTNGITSTGTEPVPSSTQTEEAARAAPEINLIHAKPLLDDVLREEANFANRDYAPYAEKLEVSPTMFRKYASPSDLSDWRQMAAVMLGELEGKDLLDYGCGMGEESVYFAKLGARVTAIDISEVGVATLKRRAEHHKLDIRAFEMRCDPTSFADASFDRVHGMGILHHVGIEAALAEVYRVLRPGGIGVFLEPMGDYAKIEAAKTFLMKHAGFLGDFDDVTDHEHNLTWREIDSATKRFSRTLTYPYHLLYRLKRFIPTKLYDTVRRFDHSMLAMMPSLRQYCGAVVIQVVK
jgi:cyclopropane fatty-acyl-phospholipid synthase-like methyltransferase